MFESILYLFLATQKPILTNLVNPAVALATRSFSLETRYDDTSVNTVFKDNILLTLKYLDGSISKKDQIVWPEIEKPFFSEFTLKPGEVFAFDSNILPEYSKKEIKTTNARFISAEGFKSDGYLVGDGVCHLASLIYWAARDAGLDAFAPSNHNFAVINEVPKEYGVGILSTTPYGNLYITNNRKVPISFQFTYDGIDLTVKIIEPRA